MIAPASPFLASTAELAAHGSDPGWRIFDCRHNLAQPDRGAAQYRAGHIPGAKFAHLEHDLCGEKTGTNGRHPLPVPSRFLAWLGERGVAPHHRVVAYDDAGGMYAARLWWLLRWFGHAQAALLDGGLPLWEAEGRPLTRDIPRYPATAYAAEPRRRAVVELAQVQASLGAARYTLLDARAANRYAGLEENIDPKAGHIPGARNRNFQLNLGAEGRFKSPQALRAEFDRLLGETGPSAVVHYCGSGVSACHNLFAMELAGLGGSRLYPGSWSEWCSDPRRPIATGQNPDDKHPGRR